MERPGVKIGDSIVWRPYGTRDCFERAGRVLDLDLDEQGNWVFDAGDTGGPPYWGFADRITMINGEPISPLRPTFNALDALEMLGRVECYLFADTQRPLDELWAALVVLRGAQEEIRIEIAQRIGIGQRY